MVAISLARILHPCLLSGLGAEQSSTPVGAPFIITLSPVAGAVLGLAALGFVIFSWGLEHQEEQNEEMEHENALEKTPGMMAP